MSGSSPVPEPRSIDRKSVLAFDSRTNPPANFLTVLRALEASPEGLTFHELSSTMPAVSLKDTLEQLLDSGLIQVGAAARYLVASPAKLEISASQALALLLFPHESSNAEVTREITSLAEQVRSAVEPRTRRWVDFTRNLTLARSSPPLGTSDERAFDAIFDAMADARLISIEYSARDGYPERRTVEPLLLWTRSEDSYLAAYCRASHAYCNFSLARVSAVTVLSEEFERRSMPPLEVFDPDTNVRSVDAAATHEPEPSKHVQHSHRRMRASRIAEGADDITRDTSPATPLSKRMPWRP